MIFLLFLLKQQSCLGYLNCHKLNYIQLYLTKCQRTMLWEKRDSNPQSQQESGFQRNLRPSTSLPCNFLFRYPVYALYTFMKFNLQLSSALFVIYRPTTFTELAGCSSNRFQFELHYHHFFYSPRGYQLPVTLPFLKFKEVDLRGTDCQNLYLGNPLLGTCAVLPVCCVPPYSFSRNQLLFTD